MGLGLLKYSVRYLDVLVLFRFVCAVGGYVGWTLDPNVLLLNFLMNSFDLWARTGLYPFAAWPRTLQVLHARWYRYRFPFAAIYEATSLLEFVFTFTYFARHPSALLIFCGLQFGVCHSFCELDDDDEAPEGMTRAEYERVRTYYYWRGIFDLLALTIMGIG